MKNNKGVTLIALVITIILLLILAGITIGSLISGNGLFSKAEYAKIETRGRSSRRTSRNMEVTSSIVKTCNWNSKIIRGNIGRIKRSKFINR